MSEGVDTDQLTAATALADLDAFVDHYGPDNPVTLIGHSWGAILATGYLRHHPERVDAAVLAEPGYLDQVAPDDYLVGQRILPAFTNHPDNPYHCPNRPKDAPSWRS